MVGVPSGIGQIKRDLGAVIESLGIVGGGGSPNELRSDAGVMVGVGVEEALKRHVELMNVDVETISVSPAALNTTSVNVFSFPEDHYILGFDFNVETNPANLVFMVLFAKPQGQDERILIGHTLLADRITFTGITDVDDYFIPEPNAGAQLPLFGTAETDYRIFGRSGAGGGFTGVVTIYRSRAPDGVEIVH